MKILEKALELFELALEKSGDLIPTPWREWVAAFLTLRDVCVVLGFLVTALITTAAVLRLSRHWLARKRAQLFIQLLRTRGYHYDNSAIPATANSAVELHEFAASSLGSEAGVANVSLERLRWHLDRNPNAALRIYKTSGAQQCLIGYCLLCALTDKAVDGLNDGSIGNGHQLDKKTLVGAGFAKASGIYILGVYAAGGVMSAGATLALLQDFFRGLLANGMHALPIYARKGTKMSASALRRFNFEDVDPAKSTIKVLSAVALRKLARDHRR